MVGTDKMSPKRLEKFVKEREAFYRGIVDIVESASEYVQPTKFQELSNYTIVDKVINDFHGFDIGYHQSWSDTIEVIRGGKQVLKLFYQGKESPPKVEFAAEDRTWEASMKRLLKDPEKSVNTYRHHMAKLQAANEDKKWKEQETENKRQDLLKKAKEMNIQL